MKRLGRMVSRLNGIAVWLGSIAVAAMILHVSVDVGMRYVFNSPLPGTILIVSTFYMGLIVFLSLAAVEEDDGHISVELIYERLGGAMRWTLRLLSILLSIGVFGALALRTHEEAMRKFDIGAFTMEAGVWIPTWPSYFVLPIGFALMLVVLLYKLLCQLTGREPNLTGSLEGVAREADIAAKLRRGGE